jgi:hypothetical protein
MMNELDRPPVRRALEELARHCLDETSPDYDVVSVSDCVEALFEAVGGEDISGAVAEAVRGGILSLLNGGTVIGVASWSGNENGASAQSTLEKWLRGSEDPVEVGLALAQNVLPFVEDEECFRVLESASRRFPQYSDRCAELIRWRRANQVRKAK